MWPVVAQGLADVMAGLARTRRSNATAAQALIALLTHALNKARPKYLSV